MAKHGKHAAGKHAQTLSSSSAKAQSEDERDSGVTGDAGARMSRENAASSTAAQELKNTSQGAQGTYTLASQENETPSGTYGVEAHGKPMYQRHKGLIAAIIVILVLLAALCVVGWRLLVAANDAAQDSARNVAEQPALDAGESSSSSTSAVEAADLIGLIGLTQDQALEKLGNGATVVATTTSTTEGDNPQTTTYVTVDLPVQTTTRSQQPPSVYLTINPDGAVASVGFTSTLRQLGFGDASFADAVNRQHAIERVVRACGVVVPDGVAVLPDDASQYRTYADDGTTVRQEQYTFSGTDSSSDGVRYDWTCRLTFDYTAANLSNNLSDTVNQIYVTVAPHVDQDQADGEGDAHASSDAGQS